MSFVAPEAKASSPRLWRVLALGCTIGRGISGLSTLALGSILAFFSIVAGAALTMKIQYWWLMKQP